MGTSQPFMGQNPCGRYCAKTSQDLATRVQGYPVSKSLPNAGSPRSRSSAIGIPQGQIESPHDGEILADNDKPLWKGSRIYGI